MVVRFARVTLQDTEVMLNDPLTGESGDDDTSRERSPPGRLGAAVNG